jgi:hypothetical protein
MPYAGRTTLLGVLLLAGNGAALKRCILNCSILLFWSVALARYGFTVATTPSVASFAVIERT